MNRSKRVIATMALAFAAGAAASIILASHVAPTSAAPANVVPAKRGYVPRRPAGSDLSAGFSALTSSAVPSAPDAVVAALRSLHPGSYTNAKDLGRGMYLATNDAVHGICGWVTEGFGQCTEPDRILGDVWLEGDMRRQYDAQTAPFEVNLYGFAHDGVTDLQVTTPSATQTIAVVNNAFRGTLKTTTFDDITAIEVVYSTGRLARLDTASLFPQHRVGHGTSATR